MNIKKTVATVCAASAFATVIPLQHAIAQELINSSEVKKPNFVTIVIDDMGYSDLGVFGGAEVITPHIDELVNNGVQLTKFYAAPTSTPSRAQFFTGRDTHTTGVGNMAGKMRAEQKDHPRYTGVIDPDVTMFPELLQAGGYHTMMTGKWDLGEEPGFFPSDRGFDQTYVLLPGGDVHFISDANGNARFIENEEKPTSLTSEPPSKYESIEHDSSLYNQDGEEVKELPANSYSTILYTDEAINMLNRWQEGDDSNKPFYLNIAHIGVHFPLQAPDCSPDLDPQFEDACTDKYLDVYAQGWDVHREQRFNSLKELGLVPQDAEMPPRWDTVPAWDSLTEDEQQTHAKKMAIYAAMIEILDQEIGKLVQHLKDIGEYENTVFFVFSDNGGSANAPALSIPGRKDFINENLIVETDNNYDGLGDAGSYIGYGDEWSMVSNTPWNQHKSTTFEGGIRTPAFVSYPGSKVSGVKYDCVHSEMDIGPTMLAMAGIEDPDTTQRLSQGMSMAGVFDGMLFCDSGRVLGWEMDGIKGLAQGDWRLTQYTNKDENFYLYNLADDPFQLNDLKAEMPEKFEEMKGIYTQYQADNGIIPVSNLQLPFLGTDSFTENTAVMTGGVSKAKGRISFNSEINEEKGTNVFKPSDAIRIDAQIRPKDSDIGSTAHLFYHAEHVLDSGDKVFYALTEDGIQGYLNEDELPFYKTDVQLETVMLPEFSGDPAEVFKGVIEEPGTLEVQFGYVTEDATERMNEKSITFKIEE